MLIHRRGLRVRGQVATRRLLPGRRGTAVGRRWGLGAETARRGGGWQWSPGGLGHSIPSTRGRGYVDTWIRGHVSRPREPRGSPSWQQRPGGPLSTGPLQQVAKESPGRNQERRWRRTWNLRRRRQKQEGQGLGAILGYTAITCAQKPKTNK